MSLYGLKQYKLAKIYKNDILAINKKLEKTITELTPYSRYKSVQVILSEMKNQKSLLDAHLTNVEKVLKSKGQIKEEI